MECNIDVISLCNVPVCGEAVVLPLLADVTGTWAFMTAFNGAYVYKQFTATANQNIVVPVALNENYTYQFRLYKPDTSVFNNTAYSITTMPFALETQSIEYNDTLSVVGRKQYTASGGETFYTHLELVNAVSVEVFIEGVIRQEGDEIEDYHFNRATGTITYNTPLSEYQRITILYFK